MGCRDPLLAAESRKLYREDFQQLQSSVQVVEPIHDVFQTFDAMPGLARARELTRALHAVSSMTRIAFPDQQFSV
jgi:hypothetical protein